MKQVRRIRKTAQENRMVRNHLEAAAMDVTTTNAKVALIQDPIPLGLLSRISAAAGSPSVV